MNLTEFLLARIAEDEAAAQAATPGPWEWDRTPGGEWGHQPPDLVTVAKLPPYSDGSVGPVGTVISSWGHDADGVEVSDEDADHIARWDPARVLAECATKRQIVDTCASEMGSRRTLLEGFAEGLLCALALPYASHPDYDEAWRP